jgi:hypothetical protein
MTVSGDGADSIFHILVGFSSLFQSSLVACIVKLRMVEKDDDNTMYLIL